MPSSRNVISIELTSTLLLLGASLLDTGNVSYASNGRLLGEQIVEKLGGNPDDSQLIPVQSSVEASARSVRMLPTVDAIRLGTVRRDQRRVGVHRTPSAGD